MRIGILIITFFSCAFFVPSDLPQQHVCKEEEDEQQLCEQEAEHPQIKEEEEELFISPETEQFVLKQELNICVVTFEESERNKPELNSDQHLFDYTSSPESRGQFLPRNVFLFLIPTQLLSLGTDL